MELHRKLTFGLFIQGLHIQSFLFLFQQPVGVNAPLFSVASSSIYFPTKRPTTSFS
jgi:hypothetical protein